MEAYTEFAKVYDMFMDNIPYSKWSEYIQKLLKEYGVSNGLVLDMGCGTGTMTELLAKKGYDMIGIDNSESMLQTAIEKREKNRLDILYLLQDMREFELYGTVKAAVCVCDSLNYILQFEELVEVFKLVNNYLDPDGIFIFDMKTVYEFEHVMADSTFAQNYDEGSFIWENSYDRKNMINEYDLTLYVKEGLNYSRYEETHYQKAYELKMIKKALEESGMIFDKAYDAFTYDPPRDNSERIYVIAREHGKKCK